jgi:trehalose 6-phosphate phosphatase
MLPTAPIPDIADLALFLDFDGTLAEIAERPELAAIPGQLKKRLAQAQTELDGALAVVSGRTIADLDQLLAPLELAAAGIHGLELRAEPGGPVLAASGEVLPPEVRARLDALAAEYPELLIEHKGESAAIHYRKAPELAERVRLATECILDELGEDFRLQAGKMVVELRPADGDKGEAIRHLMQAETFVGRRPLFIGDDITDEAGFDAVNALGGWSVFVGEENPATRARYRLDDVASVRAWLGEVFDDRHGNGRDTGEMAAQ